MESAPIKPKVIVVLVAFNDGKDIEKSILRYSFGKDPFVCIVVDNNSDDDSCRFLEKNKSKLVIYRKLDANYGFGYAANIGIKRALELGADRILVLNPDLNVTNRQILQLSKNPADLVQFALKFKRNGKYVYDWAGKVNWVLGRTWHVETSSKIAPKNIFTDYVSGGATMVKKEVYKKIGYFDEDYFLYFEDVDFSKRAIDAGFKLAVDRRVIIEHKLKEAKNWKSSWRVLRANVIFITKQIKWYFKPIAYTYLVLLTGKVLWNSKISSWLRKVTD